MESPSSFRQNNFNLVRLIAALLVMAGHMGPVLGTGELVLGGFGLHTFGVEILFLIGGFLVAGSWRRDPHVLRFMVRRFFRLWPAFAVMVLLMVFVAGPLLSELGIQGYFAGWWNVYLQNLRFYIVYAQPGVFTATPIPNVTNGSLWTMPVEAALYLMTPVLLSLPLIRKARKLSFPVCCAGIAALIALGSWIHCSGAFWVFYATDWASGLKLGIFYFIGMFCNRPEIRKRMNLQVAGIALLAILLVQQEAMWIRYTVMEIALPVLVFSLALAPSPIFSRVGSKVDLSYGIYLYGFFFQQLTAHFGLKGWVQGGMLIKLVISLTPTLVMAYLSCVFIEKPAQKLCKIILSKMNQGHRKQEGAMTE